MYKKEGEKKERQIGHPKQSSDITISVNYEENVCTFVSRHFNYSFIVVTFKTVATIARDVYRCFFYYQIQC